MRKCSQKISENEWCPNPVHLNDLCSRCYKIYKMQRVVKRPRDPAGKDSQGPSESMVDDDIQTRLRSLHEALNEHANIKAALQARLSVNQQVRNQLKHRFPFFHWLLCSEIWCFSA